ncbi:MAG TPA: type II toxin-antitoxin system Phd/YefM family antitoxin [Dongiaceae bacterium]|nr:type II toxin-antitoxin system Phd/YefM family antitoxin [Dongiaceae bacterium]
MVSINIQHAKTHLSRYAKRVKAGETIILCERNKPIAEIRPIPLRKRRVRLGVFRGSFTVPEDFNDPLPVFERDFYAAGPDS